MIIQSGKGFYSLVGALLFMDLLSLECSVSM